MSLNGQKIVFPAVALHFLTPTRDVDEIQYVVEAEFNGGSNPSERKIFLGSFGADADEKYPLALSGNSRVLAFGTQTYQN